MGGGTGLAGKFQFHTRKVLIAMGIGIGRYFCPAGIVRFNNNQ